jgi:hypothetical protein
MPPEVEIRVDGQPLRVPAGISVAAALATCGRISTRVSRGGDPRGAYCGMGVCFECRVQVDGVERLGCLTPVAGGMEILIGA